MPWLNSTLIRRLAALRHDCDVVIPQGENGLEPLHALYGKTCLGPMEESLSNSRRRIISFFPQVQVQQMAKEQIAAIDPAYDSFRNVNTPEDYFQLRAEYSKNIQEEDGKQYGMLLKTS